MIQQRLNWVRYTIAAVIVIFTSEGAEAVGIATTGPLVSNYTQGDVVLLITYILLALVFSFLCSIAEAVLLSITPSYIAGLQNNTPKLAVLLKQLKQSICRCDI